jgi:hypothetical protein
LSERSLDFGVGGPERQVEAVDAAIDAAKTVKGFPDDSSALAYRRKRMDRCDFVLQAPARP